ncbi:MAG: hypothetical protein JWN72_1906, partial [Thermoleophilia bacterium]|nr:hypothetical protein [Thermoleophilia bacterium]
AELDPMESQLEAAAAGMSMGAVPPSAGAQAAGALISA